MADTQTTSNQVVVDLTLSRGSENKNRRLTFDFLGDDGEIVKDALTEQLIPSLVGGGLSTFIQPSGWRDFDIAEEEFACTLVEGSFITKTEVKFDLGN